MDMYLLIHFSKTPFPCVFNTDATMTCERQKDGAQLDDISHSPPPHPPTHSSWHAIPTIPPPQSSCQHHPIPLSLSLSDSQCLTSPVVFTVSRLAFDSPFRCAPAASPRPLLCSPAPFLPAVKAHSLRPPPAA